MNNTNLNAEVITITPEMAREILELNTNNRPLRPTLVKTYAHDMRSGKWMLNGETIIMNGTQLLNGQHRLQACIEANVPFRSVVIRGVASNAFPTMDRHGRRSDGDVLEIMGVKNGNTAAAAAKLVHGFTKYSRERTPLGMRHAMRNERLDIPAFLVDNPMIEHSAAVAKLSSKKARFMTPSVTAAFHYMASRISIADADAFVDGITNGSLLKEGDPRLVLRNYLINRAASRTKETAEFVLVRYIHGWNAYRSGRTVMINRVRTEDSIPKMI